MKRHTRMGGRVIAGMLALPTVLLVGCESLGVADQEIFTFSFESNLAGWTGAGADLDDPPVTWSVERSEQVATRGEKSVRLVLDNLNGKGQIWIQRTFELRPSTEYDVELAFDLASADRGDVNHWTIIAGAHSTPPMTPDDLIHRGNTANGDENLGHVWLAKSYTEVATTDGDGNLVIAVGVQGTSGVRRTYFIDNVTIVFSER